MLRSFFEPLKTRKHLKDNYVVWFLVIVLNLNNSSYAQRRDDFREKYLNNVISFPDLTLSLEMWDLVKFDITPFFIGY